MCSAAHGKLVGPPLGQDTAQGGTLSCQFLFRFPRITLLCDLETDPPQWPAASVGFFEVFCFICLTSDVLYSIVFPCLSLPGWKI